MTTKTQESPQPASELLNPRDIEYLTDQVARLTSFFQEYDLLKAYREKRSLKETNAELDNALSTSLSDHKKKFIDKIKKEVLRYLLEEYSLCRRYYIPIDKVYSRIQDNHPCPAQLLIDKIVEGLDGQHINDYAPHRIRTNLKERILLERTPKKHPVVIKGNTLTLRGYTKLEKQDSGLYKPRLFSTDQLAHLNHALSYFENQSLASIAVITKALPEDKVYHTLFDPRCIYPITGSKRLSSVQFSRMGNVTITFPTAELLQEFVEMFSLPVNPIDTQGIHDHWVAEMTSPTKISDSEIRQNIKAYYQAELGKSVPVTICHTPKEFAEAVEKKVNRHSTYERFSTPYPKLSYGVSFHTQALSQATDGMREIRRPLYNAYTTIIESIKAGKDNRFLIENTPSELSSFIEVDYLNQAGFTPRGNTGKQFTTYLKAIQDCSLYSFTDKFAVVLTKPTITTNPQGQPHNDEKPALEWSDGSGYYYLNGVHFEKELWQKVTSGTMPFADILALRDVDQRAEAFRYGDVEAFLKWSNAKELDTYTKSTPDNKEVSYRLMEIPYKRELNLFRTTAYFMVYNCPSTDKLYMSGVKKAETVPEAMAGKAHLSQELWKAMQPLVHES